MLSTQRIIIMQSKKKFEKKKKNQNQSLCMINRLKVERPSPLTSKQKYKKKTIEKQKHAIVQFHQSDGDELCTTYFTRHITLHLGNEPSRDALVFFDTFQLISKIV
jgi:hypothetical protein